MAEGEESDPGEPPKGGEPAEPEGSHSPDNKIPVDGSPPAGILASRVIRTRVEVRGITVYRVRAGRVAEERGVADTAALRAQLEAD